MNKVLSAVVGTLIFVTGMSGVGTDAQATPFRISQESGAGLGDFDANVLGFFDAFPTGLTAAGFYQYNTPNGASYNGELNGGPNPVSSLSQIFLVDAADGLSLFVVHDNPNDGSGGSTRTRWNLTGDTAAQVQADDPGEPVVVSMGGMQFDSTKNWVACCTDGYAIGSLDGDWTLFGQFLTTPTGITNWAVVSSDFSTTSLVLSPGRRVRLDRMSVPEPGTLALMTLGLIGITYRLRRKKGTMHIDAEIYTKGISR